jgi:primosomal protein N'
VHVPFHNRIILAVAVATTEQTEVRSKLAQVIDVAYHAALTESDISRLVSLAESIAQSPPTIFLSTFGKLTNEQSAPHLVSSNNSSLSLSKDQVEQLQHILKLIRQDPTKTLTPQNLSVQHICCQLGTEASFTLAKLLRQKTKEQMLIVMPRERDVDLLAKLINLGPSTAVLHGHTKPYEREKIIRAWRSGRLSTLIGTLQATLIPAQKIDTVLLMNSGTDDHFSNRRNPRLDNRLTAAAQALQHNALFITTDFLPRPEELANSSSTIYSLPSTNQIIIDLKKPDEQTDTQLLSETLISEINKALQSRKKVLLFYNRKGVAKRVVCSSCCAMVICGACGNVPSIKPPNAHCLRCGSIWPIPDKCGACTTGRLNLKGIGNAHLEKALTALFPAFTVGRVEKNHTAGTGAQIQLVTEYFFSSIVKPFSKKEYGLVADLAADLSLNPENFRAEEETARKLHRISNFGKQQNATVLIQTWLPNLIDEMRNAEAWLNNETATRQNYKLPPFAAQVTVRHADAAALTAITNQTFTNIPEKLEATGRIPYHKLNEVITAIASLPDTAVVSIDQTYASSHSTHESKS